MDQMVIGQFIAERRKLQKLTQAQLAESLGITDRAVSKWERGRALPDVSVMPELCRILGITVNDLLSGKVVTKDDYVEELEKNLLEAVRQKMEADKRLLTIEWVVASLSLIVLMAPIFAAALLPMEDWLRLVLVFSGFIPGMVGFSFAMYIEQVAGYYLCDHCGHRYVPTAKAVYFAPHMGRTRYMKCPECGKKTWQKKVLIKE